MITKKSKYIKATKVLLSLIEEKGYKTSFRVTAVNLGDVKKAYYVAKIGNHEISYDKIESLYTYTEGFNHALAGFSKN